MFLFRDRSLPKNCELRNSLQAIPSVGWRKSSFLSTKIGVSYPFPINLLTNYYWKILFYLLKFVTTTEVKLKRFVNNNIKKLVDNGSYKGKRHLMFLPVRGQRTRTNAGTRRSLRSKLDSSLWKS